MNVITLIGWITMYAALLKEVIFSLCMYSKTIISINRFNYSFLLSCFIVFVFGLEKHLMTWDLMNIMNRQTLLPNSLFHCATGLSKRGSDSNFLPLLREDHHPR